MMPVDTGRHMLAIPGPSIMPDRVLQAMHRPAPNIYYGEMADMMPGLMADLNALAGSSGKVAPYIANGHGVWEAVLSNLFSPGDTLLILSTGVFAHGWATCAKGLGIGVELIEFGAGGTIDVDRVQAALSADTEHRIKALAMVHVDTSSSNRNDIAAIRAVLDECSHPALLLADCIASFGCDRFEMEQWGVDVTLTASQKGLMTPPGMGFLLYNDKAENVSKHAKCRTNYWDWALRGDASALYEYFYGTAPTHHLFGLRAALDMIKEEGREAVFDRHARLARAVWAAVDHWGQGGELRCFVSDQEQRSHAVTTIYAGKKSVDLRKWVETHAGVTLGIGLGMEPPEEYFRIGHMGHVNMHMVLGVLGVIETGMLAVGIDFEPGGLSAATQSLSEL